MCELWNNIHEVLGSMPRLANKNNKIKNPLGDVSGEIITEVLLHDYIPWTHYMR